MKKSEYLAPAAEIMSADLLPLLETASITSVTGDADIDLGTGETPTSADSRRGSVWDDGED